jgi:nitrate reductase NapE component
VDDSRETAGGSALLKALFYLIAVLTVGALGYSGWILATTWGRVGV